MAVWWLVFLSLAPFSIKDTKASERDLAWNGYNLFLKNNIQPDQPRTMRLKRPDSAGGPFWANRGKKDPMYLQEKLYIEEPRWLYTRNHDNMLKYEPFFVARGKKGDDDQFDKVKNRRSYVADVEMPFYAARGKKDGD